MFKITKEILMCLTATLLFSELLRAADRGCEELLNTVASELDSAYLENRSSLINGQISEHQFLMRIEELDAKAKRLELEGIDISKVTRVSPNSVKNESRSESSDISPYKLVLEALIDTKSHRVHSFDYNAETQNGLIQMSEGQEMSELYLTEKDKIFEEPLRLPIVTDGVRSNIMGEPQFWPIKDDLRAFVVLNGEPYFFTELERHFYSSNGPSHGHLSGMKLKSIARYSLSSDASLAHAKYYGDGVLLVRDTQFAHSAIEFELSDRKDSVHYTDLTLSPNNKLMALINSSSLEILLVNLNTKEQHAIKIPSHNVRGYGFSALSDTLNIMMDHGERAELAQISVESFIKSSQENKSFSDILKLSKRHRIPFLKDYKMRNHKFSPDGRFLIISQYLDYEEDLFTIYDLENMTVLHRGPIINNMWMVMYGFSADSQTAYFYQNSTVKVFRFDKKSPEEMKVIE